MRHRHHIKENDRHNGRIVVQRIIISGNHISKRFFIERRLICQFTFQFLKYSLHVAFTLVELPDSVPGMYPQTTMEPSIFDSRHCAWEGISHFRLETRIHVVSDIYTSQNGGIPGRFTLVFLLVNVGKVTLPIHVGIKSCASLRISLFQPQNQ